MSYVSERSTRFMKRSQIIAKDHISVLGMHRKRY